MSRIARIVSVAILPLLALLTIRIAGGQSSLKSGSGNVPVEKTTDPYVPTLTYDVASVRPAPIAGGIGAQIMHGIDARTDRSWIRLTNADVATLLFIAYGVQFQRISGLPPWPRTTVFTIEAKGDDAADAKLASLTREQQRLEQEHMMQVLLAERFKLKVHWDQGDGYSYALVVVKHGRLHESTGGPPTEAEVKRFGNHPVPLIYQRNDGTGYDWVGHGATMAALAASLSPIMGRPVADETGLLGKYDFVLRYRGATDRDRALNDMDPMPPLDQAIQDQLGLKLARRKDSVPMLVIDHIEMPSAN